MCDMVAKLDMLVGDLKLNWKLTAVVLATLSHWQHSIGAPHHMSRSARGTDNGFRYKPRYCFLFCLGFCYSEEAPVRGFERFFADILHLAARYAIIAAPFLGK